MNARASRRRSIAPRFAVEVWAAGFAALCLSLLAAATAWPAFAADKTVTIAYQDMMVPWGATRSSSTKRARETGYKVSYRQFGGGGDVIRAMASGNVEIGEAGSSPVAAGLSQGLPIELFWILDNINDAEALVARNGSGITSVAQLKGKRLGVPFVSTSHFHALLALKQAGLDSSDVKILNMRPAEIAAAWARGDIDATYVWNPVLSKVEQNGTVLTSSGKIAAQTGLATFDGLVVNRDWAAANPQFMTTFVRILAKYDALYAAHPNQWTGDTPQGKAVATVTGGTPADVAASLALYQFPTPREQASDAWLGGGPAGGAAKSLLATAAFLKQQKTLQSTLPDYSIGVTDQFVKAAVTAQ
ncbi:MAG: taurine ABC transporter substrate-binding protein [Pararobbsia sp.]